MSTDLLTLTEAPDDEGARKRRLTRREHEIAILVAEGLSNRDIADKLFISKRTVESHIDHIKQKLGIRTRTRIVVWVLRGWLIPPDDL